MTLASTSCDSMANVVASCVFSWADSWADGSSEGRLVSGTLGSVDIVVFVIVWRSVSSRPVRIDVVVIVSRVEVTGAGVVVRLRLMRG